VREICSTSLTNLLRRLTSLLIISIDSLSSGSKSFDLEIISIFILIDVKGVFISCAIVADILPSDANFSDRIISDSSFFRSVISISMNKYPFGIDSVVEIFVTESKTNLFF